MIFFHKIFAVLNKWFLFIQKNYSSFFFIGFFYSLLFCAYYIQHADLSLHSFPGRMLGQATASGVDVGKRVGVFYNSLFIIVAVNAVFYSLAFGVFRNYEIFLKELSILNILSLAGCALIFLQAFNYDVSNSIHFILLLQGIALIFMLIKHFLLNEQVRKIFSATLLSICLCIGISGFFLIKEFCFVFGITIGPDSILAILAIFCTFYFSFLSARFKNQGYTLALNNFTKIAWVLIPTMLLPLFSVIKNEAYLILNHRGIHAFTPMRIYFTLIILTAVWIYLRSRKPIEKIQSVRIYSLLSNYYLPLLILGITTCFFYSPFYVNTASGMFERANRFLPVSEFFHYHILPIAEKFNSHLVSDFFTFFLYSFLNGLKGMEPLIYDFIFPVSTALITYFIIKDFTRNPYVALFIVFLFPFTDQLIPGYFATALIAVYALYKTIYSVPSIKNYLLLFGTIFFLLLWRVDIFVASFVSMIGIFTVYALAGKLTLNKKFLFYSSLYVFAIAVVVLVFLWIRGVPIKTNLQQFYNYLSSAQAYGFSRLSDDYTLKEFTVQHFIFPVVCLLLAGYILIHFKNFTSKKRLRFAVICLLFCIGFYFINFQRGLVRHSFFEHLDMMLSSFAFFIIAASIYFYFRQKSHITKFMIFFFGGFLLITAFHYPEEHPQVPFESFYPKLTDMTHIDPKDNIQRELNPKFLEKDYKDFQTFVTDELKSDETFIDFSETPMLYYFTNKETPSVFYQGTENITNDYLQNKFIEGLSNFKTPLLLFSKFPITDNGWAYSNPYRIAEYLFQHYKPFTIVQNYCLWERTNTHFKNDTAHFFVTPLRSVGAIDSFTTKGEGAILITFCGKNDNNCGISYTKNGGTIKQKPETCFADTVSNKTYFVIKHGKDESFKFFTNHFDSTATLTITDTKYIPDFYSAIARKDNLYMIPYIWANYDTKIKSATVQNTISDADADISKSIVTYALPGQIDKSTGNYIMLSVEATNDQPVDIQLTYGAKNGEIDFTLPAGTGIRTLAVRISCQYNWFVKENKILSFYAPESSNIHLKKVLLLKGD